VDRAVDGPARLQHPRTRDDATFWALIERLDWSRQGRDDLVVAPLVQALSNMPDREIAGFADQLARRVHALDGRAWARESGPAIWSGDPDGVSVDAFLYARLAVVARGRAVYDAVLADPVQMPKDTQFEPLLYVAASAYERKTGLDDDGSLDSPVSFETFANEAGWAPGT
jgi:hypothetical protein